MKKKVVFLLCMMLLLALTVTACGSSENTEQPKNNAANENQQEEIPAIDASTDDVDVTVGEEPTKEPTPTQAPTQAPAVKAERLLLGLSESMKKYGTAELDMGLTLDLNLSDAELDELESDEYFDGIELTNQISLKVKGTMACGKTATSMDLDVELDEFGAVWGQQILQYLQLSDSGEMMNYYYNDYEGIWYLYNEGEMTAPDLTEWAQSINLVDTRQLATKTVYKEIEMKEEADKYLVDGVIDFKRFKMFASIANMFNQEIMSALPDDMEIKLHMEFNKDDLSITVLSIYLDNLRPLTQNDRAQFSEMYFEMKYDISPNGAQIVIPAQVIDSAISAN